MGYLEALFQAVLQGLTEFLPVSSSGHLSLFQHFTGLSGDSGVFFSLMLHLGTLAAVFAAFYQTIWQLILELFSMLADIFTGKFRWKNRTAYRNMLVMLVISCLPMILVLVLKDFYTALAADEDIIVEGICFLITAALLFTADHCVKGKKGPGEIKTRDALLVGALQAVAPLPGVSRSGSTIAGGLLSGMTRETAVQYSFILGIPAILGGSLSEVMDISAESMEIGLGIILLGVAVSAVVGFLSIKLVSWLIKSDKFQIFIWYTGILGVLTIAVGIFEKIVGMNLTQYLMQ